MTEVQKDKSAELLVEWFQLWATSPDMPAKLPNSLHTKTIVYLMTHAYDTGGPDAVQQLLKRLAL